MKKELVFKFERETPGTYRFKEEAAIPAVGTLYVKKGVFASKPETLKMTLEW
jgi:hypothetical protein